MADILETDVKIYKSEDQTDETTGGGRMASDVVVSGVVNNLFPNISRIDRLQGRIQLRKIFQKIDSENVAVYSGGHLIIQDMPLDENVSVLMFDTNDHNDVLPQIVDYLESFYITSTPVGNAGLLYDVAAGGEQLVFKIRHYEYTPTYDKDGKLVYLKKIDAKYTFNATVGDLLILDDGAGTVEHIHIQQMERVTETLDDSDDKHYYIVEYITVVLSAGLIHEWAAGTVPYRSAVNTAWQAFGPMVLAADAMTGDTLIDLVSTRARLAPTIARQISVSDQAFFGPGTIADDVAIGADGFNWILGQAEEINVSEAIDVISGKISYVHVLQNKPLKASTLQIWYLSNLGWYVIEETAGALSGAGTGNVSADGVVSVTLAAPADPDTKILLYYSREHNLTENIGINLTSPDIVYDSNQVAVPAETDTITGTLSACPVQSGFVRLLIDTGTGFEIFGRDGGGNVITGDNIEACSIDYLTGEWSLTFKAPYTDGVVLKWEYIVLAENSWIQNGNLGNGFSGQNTGMISIQLAKTPVKPGSVSLTVFFYIRYAAWSIVTKKINLVDTGNGNLVFQSGDGNASGSVNYDSGLCIVSFDFSIGRDMIHGDLYWSGHYYYYLSSVFAQTSLPYRFSVGRSDIIPETLLIKYFTDGVDAAWYARAKSGGILELMASMTGWTAGPAFDSLFATFDAVWDGVRWMAVFGAQSANQASIWMTNDGRQWVKILSFSENYFNPDRIAFRPEPQLYIVVDRSGEASDQETLACSANGIDWTVSGLPSDPVLRDVCYCPGPDIFVIVSASSIWTSSDGANWTSRTSQISTMEICVTAELSGIQIVMAFGQTTQAQYSTDGIVWTETNSKLSGSAVGAAVMQLDGVNVLFVVDDLGNVVQTVDGTTFELLDAAVSGTPTFMAGDGMFNLVVSLSDGTISVSNDFGVTWNNQTLDHQWTSVSGNKVFFGTDAGWMNLSYGNDGASDQAKSASLPVNIMTDNNGDPIREIGTFNAETGIGEITAGDLPTSAQARYFLTVGRVSSFVVFSWGATPIYDNSFIAFGETYTGALFMLSEDPENPGTLIGNGTGFLDKVTGIAMLDFSCDIRPESLRLSYDYGSIYRPEYDEINTRAMPLDGLVPIAASGDTAVLIEHARAHLTADITDTEMAIDIDDGSIFPDREITIQIDDEKILGTMSGNTFAVTTGGRAYDGSTAAVHYTDAVMILVSRHEEMLPILRVAGNRIETINELFYNYKAGGAILTTAIVKGDLAAIKTDWFTQAAELADNAWQDSDEYTGSPADDTYDFTNYPLTLTNKGATTERWKLKVVQISPVLVDVIGENLGTIAEDQPISSVIAPVNPNTGMAYFSVNPDGWGSGWQFGNILRLNTEMAGGPAWVCRVINARSSDTVDDYTTLQSRGDVAI